MTESEAKNIVRRRLEQDADEEYPLVWVGDIFSETPDTFIIEGSGYSEKEGIDEGRVFCAVHKTTGRCGLVPPLPGVRLTKELFKSFSWDGSWVVI